MPREIKALGTHGAINTTALPNGTYRAETRIRDYDGVTRRVRAVGASKYKAEQNLKAKLLERNAPHKNNTIHSGTKVTELADIWFTQFQKENDRANTLKRYDGVIESYLKKRMAGIVIRECTPGLLTSILNGIKHDHGYSSAKQTKTVLSNMFKLAVKYNALTQNPVRDVELKQDRNAPRKAVDALTLEEAHKVLAACSGDVLAVVQVMLGTGARIGETLMLRWQDLDLTPGRSSITFSGTFAQKFGNNAAGRQEHTKSDSSMRTVYIPDELADILRDRAQNHIPPHALTTAWATPESFVFPTTTGTVLDPNNFRTRFRKQVAAAELGRTITPHIFRKTVATLVSREDSLTVASQLLGHSSEKITEDYYIQKLTETANASKTLGVYFNPTVL